VFNRLLATCCCFYSQLLYQFPSHCPGETRGQGTRGQSPSRSRSWDEPATVEGGVSRANCF